MSATEKRCTKCGTTYPATREFFAHRSSTGQLKSHCRECEKARVRAWRAANPDTANAGYRRRQRRLDGWTPTAQQKVDLYFKADGKCRYCNSPLGTDAQVDHAIPVARGGSNDMENLDLICPRCNQEKGDKTPEEYIAWNARSV